MKHWIGWALASMATGSVSAQTVDPAYECAYQIGDIGSPPGVPANLGGLVFKAGDPNTLLIGGAANQAGAAIYEVGLVRDAENRVIGYAGPAQVYASAPNIDGGLFYGPDNVLFFSRYSMNSVGQILPGSTAPDKDIGLSALGFTASVGAMTMVPEGFGGAGRLKVFPYNSGVWHDAELTPDGLGTFDISAPQTAISLGGGPEGIVYVEAGATLFPAESVLISEFSLGTIASYQVDLNGDPVPGTRAVFISGLSGAEGGTRDPVTGDFLFSTYGGGNRVLVVRGFTPDCDSVANFNRDCVVNIFDVFAFLEAYTTQDPSTDVNGDTVINVFDVFGFLTLYADGC